MLRNRNSFVADSGSFQQSAAGLKPQCCWIILVYLIKLILYSPPPVIAFLRKRKKTGRVTSFDPFVTSGSELLLSVVFVI